MKINPVEVLPVECLRNNPDNPKGPLGLKYKRGLRAAIDRYGFAGVLVVADNTDGTYEVLDGNTRLADLLTAGVEKIPCVVFCGLDADERKRFVLAHDRHRKQFDEDAVLSQLEDLARKGGDLKELALLSGKDNLERLLAESAKNRELPTAAKPQAITPEAMGSMVLYGPVKEVAAIKGLLKSIKGHLSQLEKARKALAESLDFLEWDDERTLTALLATIAALGKEP